MGRRGPKTTPTALKIERGNPGHRPINQEEPKLPPASLAPPKGFKGAALEEWHRLGPMLVESGVLTDGDRQTFVQYCAIVGEIEEYEKISRRSRRAAHALGYASYLFKLRGQLKQFAAELGLTPASRSGVKATPKKTDQADTKKRRFFGQKHA